jgi:formiminotetrahydrofolate cyclodeaminase/Zn-dependent peptidase ImmA (M78 family)
VLSVVELIKLSTEELLRKFGSGNHKPGSGSAAAVQGLLSAQLIRTVIDLTKAKEQYKEWLPDLNRMATNLKEEIYPKLLYYFQLDSEQFDRVIQLRRERDDEKDPVKKRELIQSLDDALLPATQTPIAIAKLSTDIARYALFMFKNGFRSARGDSGVALNNAIATVAGCLSIINLNLLSLGDDEETEQIRKDAALLKSVYLELFYRAHESLDAIEREVQRNLAFQRELKILASGQWIGKKLSYVEIEDLARRLQNTLYKYHDKFSKRSAPENVIEVLKPQIVLTKILGYHYEEPDTLGHHLAEGSLFEIAGIIDKSKKSVAVSMQFSKETRNFTAAHELGHALLHRQNVLHRDKAIDGSGSANPRKQIEAQADKFATYFLMPRKTVESLFRQLFFTDKFVINDDTVFALTNGSISAFRKKCKTLHDLARILASAESYGGQAFNSLAEMFNVSDEAMAIRIRELGLAEYPSFG